MSKWVKQSGDIIVLNDEAATVEAAEKLGWIEYDQTEKGIAELEAKLAKVKKAVKKKEV